MKDIFTGVIMKGCGKHTFEGLFDSDGRAVNVTIEKSDDEVILAFMYDKNDKTYNRPPRDCGISAEEIDRVCQAQDNCDDCPLFEHCAEECEDE